MKATILLKEREKVGETLTKKEKKKGIKREGKKERERRW